MAKIDISDEDFRKNIEGFLTTRFDQLDGIRKKLDEVILEEIDLYNDIDSEIEALPWYKEKQTIAYIYTIVQTMVARLIQTLFGKQNYLKIYVENDHYQPLEKEIQQWVQSELDKIKFKSRSRDFLETSLVQKTAWLHLRPKVSGEKFTGIDFNIHDHFEVWYDTKAKIADETDFFIKKIKRLHELSDEMYVNLFAVRATKPPDDIALTQIYKAENETTYYDPARNNITDEVELMEWYGYYDMGEGKFDEEDYVADFKAVIFTLANRTLLVRAETIDLKTKKKILMFPIRPLKQPRSLLGKSVPQITKKLQRLLNQTLSKTVQNFKLQTGLLFKYKKNSGIDLTELFAKEGNAIGYEDDPNEISIFETPNMVQMGLVMIGQIIQFMQQGTGAVDYVMGTSAGRGVTETASGIKQITDQAMFKFMMMAENIHEDITSMINYMIILWSKYGKESVLETQPELQEFLDQLEETIEESNVIDIGLNDLTIRRDVERQQVVNAAQILVPLIQASGGDMKEFSLGIMEALNMPNIKRIFANKPGGADQLQQLQQMLASLQGGGQQVATRGTGEQNAAGQ